MLDIPEKDPRAVAIIVAIRGGDVERLQAMLHEDPSLAAARIVDDHEVKRTLLHILTDWPGHYPNGSRTAAALIQAGADVNARITPQSLEGVAETPLHWAASSNDVTVIDALLKGGADIEATGAVFTGGTPMSDAVVFAQWNAARRLLERGAKTTVWQAAALGLEDRVRDLLAMETPPSTAEVTNAFWHACRGGQRQTAEILYERGADPDWIGYDRKTPRQVGHESGDEELIAWLRDLPLGVALIRPQATKEKA